MRIARFACTQCGACCNRSPEVALSEAAGLADVFVFRLMFRLYALPRSLAHYRGRSAKQFYESKRLLSAFAAHSYRTKFRVDGKPVEYDRYLVLSALTLDRGVGACGELCNGRCSIYDRRPLACRSVPLGYSRAECFADNDLRAFVATPGYRCDTGDTAPILLEDGRILDHEIKQARVAALEVADQDRAWAKAIVRKMKSGSSALPSLRDIEANAPTAAATVSMAVAWQVAANIGLLRADDCKKLIELQAATIDRELDGGTLNPTARETLLDMGAEYRQLIGAS